MEAGEALSSRYFGMVRKRWRLGSEESGGWGGRSWGGLPKETVYYDVARTGFM